jgi:hypothetical protein
MTHEPIRISKHERLNSDGTWRTEAEVQCSCGQIIWHQTPLSKGLARTLIEKHAEGESWRRT